MKTITLVGHSGCKLEVKERDGNHIVIKTSKDVAYNTRLKKQHEKQKGFTNEIFRTPAVHGEGHGESGLYQFSMEYVHGFTLAEHLKKADASSIQSIADKFLSLIPKEYRFDPDAKDIFGGKIQDLKSKIDAHDPATKKALEKLESYQWRHVVKSECHGDLSLENIIWKDGDLYLIDFLDSFYDSWMIDYGKLLFDIECRWSYRNETGADENLKTRLSIFKEVLLDDLRKRKGGNGIIQDIYHAALLHILRIIPYTNDDHTKKYLQMSVNKIQSSIDAL